MCLRGKNSIFRPSLLTFDLWPWADLAQNLITSSNHHGAPLCQVWWKSTQGFLRYRVYGVKIAYFDQVYQGCQLSRIERETHAFHPISPESHALMHIWKYLTQYHAISEVCDVRRVPLLCACYVKMAAKIFEVKKNKSPGGLNAHLNWRKLPLVHIGVCYQLEKLWRPSSWLLFT